MFLTVNTTHVYILSKFYISYTSYPLRPYFLIFYTPIFFSWYKQSDEIFLDEIDVTLNVAINSNQDSLLLPYLTLFITVAMKTLFEEGLCSFIFNNGIKNVGMRPPETTEYIFHSVNWKVISIYPSHQFSSKNIRCNLNMSFSRYLTSDIL